MTMSLTLRAVMTENRVEQRVERRTLGFTLDRKYTGSTTYTSSTRTNE